MFAYKNDVYVQSQSERIPISQIPSLQVDGEQLREIYTWFAIIPPQSDSGLLLELMIVGQLIQL